MKFHGPFRDVQLAGDLFVGEIFQQRIEDFLFAAAEIRDGIGLQPATLAGKNGIYESGEKLPRNPESSAGNERERANQLLAGFHVGQKPLYSKAQKRKTVGFIVLLPDDDEAGFGIAFHKIGQERTGSGFGGVGVDDVDLGAGRLHGSQVGRERGFKLLGEYLEWRFRQNAFELAQHQRVGREDANGKFRRSTFGSHCLPGY